MDLENIKVNGNLHKNFNHALFYIDSNSDLDLWPSGSKLCRDHQHAMKYVHTKFEDHRRRHMEVTRVNGNLHKNFNQHAMPMLEWLE